MRFHASDEEGKTMETDVQFANQYIDLEFTDLYFHCAGPGQRAFIEGYARDVFPELRKLKP